MTETALDKFDIKKVHKGLYSPSSREFSLVDVPPLRYLAVDGHGDPNTSAEYRYAIEALYAVAYTVKFDSKSLGRDFVVGPLEGLWWAADMAAFTSRDKGSWDWTMMLVLPDWITEEQVGAAVDRAAAKRDLVALPKLRLHAIDEGTCVQILHVGSYDDEGPILDRLHHQFMPEHALTFNGHHHEIYLSDARRTVASKLKTVLRQPVRAAGG